MPTGPASWMKGMSAPKSRSDDRRQVDEGDGAGRGDDAHAQLLGDPDAAGGEQREHDQEHADGEADGLQHDAVELHLVEVRDAADEQALGGGVERRGDPGQLAA